MSHTTEEMMYSRSYKQKLGLDFGGVITPLRVKNTREDTSFDEDFLNTEPFDHAIENISKLVELFEDKVFIISKVGKYKEDLTRRWLNHHNFHLKTGLPEENVYYCRTRAEKGPICRELGITHFVDDRIHIMQILKEVVPNLYLFGDKQKNHGARNWVRLAGNWEELFEILCQDYRKSE
jgi:hypothetical protein